MLFIVFLNFMFFITLVAPVPQVRLVGAQQAKKDQFPYQAVVLIYYGSKEERCGGSLISEEFVLTAASCVYVAPQVDVILGAYNLNEDESSRVRFIDVQVIKHENFTSRLGEYDIALLKLPQKVDLNDSINVVKLSNTSDEQYVGDTVILSSFGADYEGGDFSPPKYANILTFIKNAVITNEECDSEFPITNLIKPSHVCVAGTGLKVPCTGDAGSPVVDNGVQIGIVSVWYPLCITAGPYVNTRVAFYRDWIASYISI